MVEALEIPKDSSKKMEAKMAQVEAHRNGNNWVELGIISPWGALMCYFIESASRRNIQKYLTEASDHHLNDIGVMRDDIPEVALNSVPIDAESHLHIRAATRSTNW